jgi:hypothetical protein
MNNNNTVTFDVSRNLNNIGSNINLYTALVLNPIGFVTNILSLFVYTRPRLNKTNMGYLYFWQTSIDICLLGMLIFIGRSREIFGQELSTQSNVLCTFTRFIRRFLVHISSWINVLICFDRLVFVLFPRNKLMKSKLNLTLIIAGLVVSLTLVNTPNFFYSLTTTVTNVTTTTTTTNINTTTNNTNQTSLRRNVCAASTLMHTLSISISVFARTIVPLIFMALMCFIIRKRLNSNKLKLTSKKNKREAKFAKTVASLTLLFMLFNFPLGLTQFIEIFIDYFDFGLSQTTQAAIGLCSTIALNFSFLYQSFYFFITLAFNRLFRREIVSIFVAIAKRLFM